MNAGDSHKQLGAALGRIPSGLFIVTVRDGGSETGLLASWVQQCSFEPPMISVAVQKDREIHAALIDGARFTVNVLDDTQTDMIAHFGRGFTPGQPAFEGLEVMRQEREAPVLIECLAYLRCQVAGRCQAGDHHLILARVTEGKVLNEGHPMVHIRKSGFHY